MRKGWRVVNAGWTALLLGALVGTVAQARGVDPSSSGSDRPARLSVEISWSSAGAEKGDDLELEVSEGQVVGALTLAGDRDQAGVPERKGEGVWRLGPRRGGRVRVRVEAPLSASLVFRSGTVPPMRFPLSAALDGTPKTPPQAPIEITVKRLPWDVIGVDLTIEPGHAGTEGVVSPVAKVAVSVGFHILTPEPAEALVHCVVELRPARGGDVIWRYELKPTVPTNISNPPIFVLPLDAPKDEGTYVLDLNASWEPAPAHERGKLLNSLIRRGKRGLFGSASASRRVTFTVLGADGGKGKGKDKNEEKDKEKEKKKNVKETEVDSVDLARLRGHRTWGSGRSPLRGSARSGWTVPDEALASATTRERRWGLGGRAGAGADVSVLGPVNSAGLAWSSVGLKIAHPGRPHRLSLTVAAGESEGLGVALVGFAFGQGQGARPRLLLDTAAAGLNVAAEGNPATYSWLVWPDSTEPVLVLVNRGAGATAKLGQATLTELGDLPDDLAVEPPGDAPERVLGLYLAGLDALDRFGGLEGGFTDPLIAAKNLGAYLSACGATSAVLPQRLADRERRRALDGTFAEDSIGPDRLDLALRVLAKRGAAVWLELALDGPLPGLPAPGTAEALAKGLTRIDRHGLADGPVPAYYPLTDEVAAAMRKRVLEAVGTRKNLAGVLVRLGAGPTLPGGSDTGFDDATFARFVREAFDAETAKSVPGRSSDDAGRFEARAKFVAGPGRMPWLSWRSKRVAALYADLAAAAREASPGAAFAVATPVADDGPAGAEARRADLAGLAPSLAWRAIGLDLDAWPTGEHAPIVLRGVGLGHDDLSHDLATSPELDAEVAARPARGLLLDLGVEPVDGSGVHLASTALANGPNGDEPLGHALAALDAQLVWLAASAVSGHEERLRRFARVFRALPATPAAECPPLAFGVSVRAHLAGSATYLALANDTPYPVRLDTVLAASADAPIFDLGRALALKPVADAAGRHLVLDLAPFGVAAVRVGSSSARIGSVTPYPAEAVLTTLRARYKDVEANLTRLNHGGDRDKDRSNSGPPNPGFEADAPRETALRVPDPMNPDPPGATDAPAGWQVVGGMGQGVALDVAQPHSGRAALRLDAPTAPASVICDAFTPGGHSALLLRAWLRADRPDARVRLWIEGESGGKPYRRVSEMTISSVWSERSVRAGDVPADGLETLRLRFELLTPGSLWLDDLSVVCQTLSEPERRNTRNALLAALQAYREKRFADFARLSGSHWVRRPGAEGSPERIASERSGLLRGGDPSALPPVRRLR